MTSKRKSVSSSYDVIVIGAGPAGEVAASRLNTGGLRTALIERELVGGECAYWACIPSKTLLRPGEVVGEAGRAAGISTPDQRWDEIAAYRDFMIRHLDDSTQVDGYRGEGVDVYKGEARLAGAGRVDVGGETLEADRIVLANGSDTRIPPIAGLEEAGYWTNREATTLSEIPQSIAIIGGGPVGIELGQFLARLGTAVILVQHGHRLVPREDPAAAAFIAEVLRDDGVDVRLGRQATAVARTAAGRSIELDDGSRLEAQELLIATGRAPRVEGLGLESVGIEARSHGIVVDGRCRAGTDLWAVGDVTGVMPFTHVGMYQARIAAADILGRSVKADYTAIPRVVFCDPELAAVGLTEQQAREQGHDVVATTVDLADVIARPWTYEREPRGRLGVVVDRRDRVVLGAWAVSPLAGEWIHYAALAVKTRTPVDVLRDTVAQFPTYTEAYLKALERIAL